MAVLDTTIINIALPSAQGTLHVGTASRQSVIIAYSLAFGGLLLLGARLSDIVGRRTPVESASAEREPDSTTSSRLRTPMSLGTKLFGIALAIPLTLVTIMVATLHGSRSNDEVVRSCLGTTKPKLSIIGPVSSTSSPTCATANPP